MNRRDQVRVWGVCLLVAALLGSAGPAFGFGEVFEMTGSGKIWHFEAGPFTPAPITNFNSSAAGVYIAQNIDSSGKVYACWENGTTLLVDTDESFPNPQVFTGLLSSNGDYMVYTMQDGRAVMLAGSSPINKATSAIMRIRGEAYVLTGELQSPGSFDHFSRSRFDIVKLVGNGSSCRGYNPEG